MQFSYLINRVSEHEAPRIAIVDGEEMSVIVKELEVELVDETGRMGSQTLRFVKTEDKEAARAKYVQGETLTIEV